MTQRQLTARILRQYTAHLHNEEEQMPIAMSYESDIHHEMNNVS